MRYIGGKSRIANWLREQILPIAKGRRLIEPFCGGLSATVALQPALASDKSLAVISLIQACRRGWEPPESLSEEEYRMAKTLPESDPLHGFAAFCCSFGGKYWGGYAREKGRNFAREGRNSLLRKVRATARTEFACASYDQLEILPGDVVYCDPPYAGTTMGYSTGPWDAEKFWDWCREISNRGATVIVSEFNAPQDIPILARQKARTDLRTARRAQGTVETLFILEKVK